ncbi:Y-family DNA polymerase [Flavobacteriaceae bacterium]|nr:Y-family DNA polymerase [Flavobacteriales bacterium]MBL6878310.1 Y-family DNA polymerase [Flavobacteriaceae bacterium]MDA9550913.1 Y-family DNA polymerase [Flavobacteriaceae bacterium]MDA9849675.1 Y-family DNA polymerase [Flavobacteriaceae bacterium]MDB2599545.1 Y-family DNA polymerase [Flavobacteriaceae bacterium]
MFALVDCNNFYASCERVFNPNLQHKPIVILSNNDGCIISRSDEAKKLGIPMGAPIFKYRSLIANHNVKVFSSNYSLYGDMSSRVMSILKQFTPDIQVYSIDESFLKLEGFEDYNLTDYGMLMKNRILKWTGIPTCAGIAPTKALSKVANKIARKYPNQTNGVYVIDTELKRINALKWTKIKDIWGIGKKLSNRLATKGCKNAYDFTQLPESWVKSNMSVVESRLQRDLLGIPTLDLEVQKSKKSIATTRTFEKPLKELDKIKERISTFAFVSGEKLRRQNSHCHMIIVILRSNYFREDLKQHYATKVISLPYPTNSSLVLSNYAIKAIEEVFKSGIAYKKAGIILTGLVPSNNYQLNIFDWENSNHQPLMKAIDKINYRFSNKIKLANQDLKKTWKMKQDHLSPNYTTNLQDIIKVK